MESNIFFNPTLSRFEWEIDGYIALAEFQPKFSIRNLLQLPTASNTRISEQFLTSK
jgi:hypothetical protein